MQHTLCLRVSSSMLLKPRGEKRPSFSVLPLTWHFASFWWRGLDTAVAVQNEQRGGCLLCCFCSSGAPTKTLYLCAPLCELASVMGIREMPLPQYLVVPAAASIHRHAIWNNDLSTYSSSLILNNNVQINKVAFRRQ